MATATLRMKADRPADEKDLWARGELGHWLGFRCPSRVEVIGGDVFVSWASGLTSAQTFSTVLASLVNGRGAECPRDVRMLVEGDADFAVVDVERWTESWERFTSPWLGELVAIEVTAPDAAAGRRPGAARRRGHPTRTELARLGVPCYLLVDRAPEVAEAYLFAKPDVESGRFTRSETVPFGESFRLPDPIGLTVSTDRWRTWE
ncbi:hypothetical protein GCM10009838_40140 [Catenulispora subtropica]|uniref:Restriction endonuclease domain-containing protein n=2 Tax=Catenulispora subtropica TaxID=450798 RepID=A0ABN2RW37_9ACTN